MPLARTIALTDAERLTLVQARDRERDAAILKVTAGWPVRHVAAAGLLRPCCPETVGA